MMVVPTLDQLRQALVAEAEARADALVAARLLRSAQRSGEWACRIDARAEFQGARDRAACATRIAEAISTEFLGGQ